MLPPSVTLDRVTNEVQFCIMADEVINAPFNKAVISNKNFSLSVVLFIMLYKVVLSFESVDEIFKCGHSYGSC